jgi:hypothetical protein
LKILPLFTNYLLDHCFAKSLIGKIGFVGDFSDLEKGQELLQFVEKKYTRSEHQSATKKFPDNFSYWAKEVSSWKYFLSVFSYSNYMVNKQVKLDLRYFKDANVDTLIPLNYGYFHFQKTIGNIFNFKKTRFHTLDKVFL